MMILKEMAALRTQEQTKDLATGKSRNTPFASRFGEKTQIHWSRQLNSLNTHSWFIQTLQLQLTDKTHSEYLEVS